MKNTDFDALSDAHYGAIGRLLVLRNKFIDRCAVVLLVAQCGMPGRGSPLRRALACGSICEMTEKVSACLSLFEDRANALAFSNIITPHRELFQEIDKLLVGRWGLIDFTRADAPVLYSDKPGEVDAPSYTVADIEAVVSSLSGAYASLKPLLIPSSRGPESLGSSPGSPAPR